MRSRQLALFNAATEPGCARSRIIGRRREGEFAKFLVDVAKVDQGVGIIGAECCGFAELLDRFFNRASPFRALPKL